MELDYKTKFTLNSNLRSLLRRSGYLFIFLTFNLHLGTQVFAQDLDSKDEAVLRVKTQFGTCPSKAAGDLAIRVFHLFEETGSLFEVKNHLAEHFKKEFSYFKSYKVKYDPIDNLISISLDCSFPLAKLFVESERAEYSYQAILGNDGRIVDPTIEILLRKEDHLDGDLPEIHIAEKLMSKEIVFKIKNILKRARKDLYNMVSDIIVSDTGELILVLSVPGHGVKVYFGDDNLDRKVDRLYRVMVFFSKKEKVPSVINLKNIKKILVKF